MFAPRDFEALTSPGGQPGDLGFKLVGRANEGTGMVRVWLRRSDPWARYPDPRFPQSAWDIRMMVRTHNALATQDEFSWERLESLEEAYTFPSAPSGLAALKPNGDPVHDKALAWAKKVTGAGVALPVPQAPVPAVEAEGEDDWNLESSPTEG